MSPLSFPALEGHAQGVEGLLWTKSQREVYWGGSIREDIGRLEDSPRPELTVLGVY